MADGAAGVVLSEPPVGKAGKKGLLKRSLIPVLMLVIGAAGGAAASIYIAPLFLASGPEKPPVPKVAPLQYVEIDNNFTSNLRDSSRFVQLKVAVSTQGGQPVIDAIQRHHIAIVAAILTAIAETSEADIDQPGGREALTRRMRIAVNDVLQRKSGVAGVDDVFLTNFVMQ